MNNKRRSVTPATDSPQDSLSILREVSHLYDLAEGLRRSAARQAHRDGATLRAIGEAMGRHHSSAWALIKRDAAA